MEKTITIYATHSEGTRTPYVDDAYDFSYPVSFLFEIPDALKTLTPSSITFALHCGGLAGTTGGETTVYNTDPNPTLLLKNKLLGIRFETDPFYDSSGFLYAGAYIAGSVSMRPISYGIEGTPVYAGMEVISLAPHSVSSAYEKIKNGTVKIYGPGINTYNYGKTFISDEISANRPFVTLTFNGGSLQVEPLSPLGFIDEGSPNVFSWRTSWSGYPVESVEQESAVLEWRNGPGGAVQSINIADGSTSYTMPAGTLPNSDNIQWRVTVTTTEGTASSVWRTIATVDAIPAVSGLYPNGVYVDNTGTSRFTWRYDISTGTPQTKYDLQVKTALIDWQTIRTDSTSDTYADIPAGSLESGTIQWRVRGYNSDNVASEWSAPLTCVVVAVPGAPEVEVVDTVPRATVRWTAQDQQAYQVKVGDYDSGLIYGTEKSHKLPVFLSDGLTAFYVRTMNSFGYWSEYGSASTTVENTPYGTLALTVTAGNDAYLTWSAIATAVGYRVFRDGIKIKDTAATSYTDKLAVGAHTYQVFAILPDDKNYTPSNLVSVDITVNEPIISTLSGEWLSLAYTLTSLPSSSSTIGRDVYLMQYDGHEYPEVEVGEFRAHTYGISAAFASGEDGRKLENLVGQIVILKNQYGELIVGVLAQLQKAQNTFTVSYTGTLTEVDRSEYERS